MYLPSILHTRTMAPYLRLSEMNRTELKVFEELLHLFLFRSRRSRFAIDTMLARVFVRVM